MSWWQWIQQWFHKQPPPPPPPPGPPPTPPITAAAILSFHNDCRTVVGVPPLVWDDTLAAGAAEWATHLVALGYLQHSGVAGLGENLAAASTGSMTTVQMVNMWVAEQKNFYAGVFPNVSKTGNWADVGHYTQMIWGNTTHVGGAIARGPNWDILVCRYAPQGNVMGESVL